MDGGLVVGGCGVVWRDRGEAAAVQGAAGDEGGEDEEGCAADEEFGGVGEG